MNFSIEEELPIILLKEYELNFHIKGYSYMMKWNPSENFSTLDKNQKTSLRNLQLQSKNGMLWSDIYQKEKLFDSKKLRGGNENSCKAEVTGRRMNLGDGEGIQIPCKLQFTGDAKYIDKSTFQVPLLPCGNIKF